MAKKKKKLPIDPYTKQAFRSFDELYISWYFEELLEHGYITKWKYEAKTYELGTTEEQFRRVSYEQKKTKVSEHKSFHSFVQGHKYTPDFHVRFTEKAENIFYCKHDQVVGNTPFILFNSMVGVFEVKPETKGKWQGSKAKTNISRKWLLEKHKVFAQEIHFKDLFFPTFTPKKYLNKCEGQVNIRHFKDKSRLRGIEDYVRVVTQLNIERRNLKNKFINQ